jgi:V/A-type H+/Na+-transporting ATPase subunit K
MTTIKNILAIGLILLVIGAVGVSAAEGDDLVVEEVVEGAGAPMFSGNVLAAIGAAIAISVTGFCSAKALLIAGNAAAGVTGEDETNFSGALVMDAMPQTQVIYGFIIAMLITLGIMGNIGAGTTLSQDQGWIAIFAGLAVGITGISAIFQGKVAAASMAATAKNQSIKGKVLIFIVMPEIAALFGFVIGIMFLIAAKIF